MNYLQICIVITIELYIYIYIYDDAEILTSEIHDPYARTTGA